MCQRPIILWVGARASSAVSFCGLWFDLFRVQMETLFGIHGSYHKIDSELVGRLSVLSL